MVLDREQRIAAVMMRRYATLQIILERVDDPHNVGAILRSCDAVGVGRVHLLYPDGKQPRMHALRSRAAASAAKWLDIHYWSSVAACVSDIKASGNAMIYMATLSPEGRAPWDCDLAAPCAIAVGNEHDGPSEELMAAADGIITIPMQGFVESFNVSVAASICLADALRQRLAA